MTEFKPAAFFGIDLPGEGFLKVFGLTGSVTLLAGPSAPTFDAEPGVNNGEIDISVNSLPTSWGDLDDPGDGLGVAGKLQWWNDDDGWQDLVDPAATGLFTVTVGPGQWGSAIEVRVRGVNDAGNGGGADSATVTPPGNPHTLDSLLVLAEPATVLGDPAFVFIPA